MGGRAYDLHRGHWHDRGRKLVSSLSGCAASLALDDWAVHVPVDLVHLSLGRGRERATAKAALSERGAWHGTAPSETPVAERPIKEMPVCQTKYLAKVQSPENFCVEFRDNSSVMTRELWSARATVILRSSIVVNLPKTVLMYRFRIL